MPCYGLAVENYANKRLNGKFDYCKGTYSMQE